MPFQFGKVTLNAGVPIPLDMGGQGLSGIVIGNESGLTLTVELQGANSKSTIYPGTVDFIPTPLGRNWNGNLIITPSSDLGNVNFWPGSYAYIDVYGSGEFPKGSYPLSLNRAGNIGNQVTLVAGSSTSVQNDNNAAGTSVVEATTLGSPSSNVELYNDGSGWFGRWVNPTFTKIFQLFSAGTTAIQLAATGLLTEVLGNFKVDGTSTFTGNATFTGTATFNNAGASIDANSHFNGAEVDVGTVNSSTVNTGTVNCTTVNGGSGGVAINNGGGLTVNGTSYFNGSTNHGNATEIQFNDSGGTGRNVLGVDGSNNVNINGVTGTDLLRFLKSDNTLQMVLDLINGSINLSTPSTTINGGSSGTAVHWMPFQGSALKLVLIKESNFKTGGSNQDYTLPTPFTNGAMFFCGDVVSWDFVHSGAVQSCNIMSAFGTAAFTNPITSYEMGNLAPNVAFDTIRHVSGAAASHTGWILIIGN